MREWRTSTAGIWWWPSRAAIRTCRGGPGWKTATTSHVHGRGAPQLTTASWRWGVGISACRWATLTVAVVVLASIVLIIAAASTSIFVVAVVGLVLIVLLWLVVLLGTRSARVLSLWRSLVCHR